MRSVELRRAIESCMQRELEGDVAVLFSGGLDSTLLAALARSHCRPSLYTAGFPGSHDVRAAERGARELGLPWEHIVLDDGTVRRGVAFLRSEMGMVDPVTVSFELPLYFACNVVPEDRLMTGQGADELFGGYARYAAMAPLERGSAMRSDQERLLREGGPKESLLARRFGKTLICPYLCPQVIEVARGYSSDELIGPLGNKAPLRRLASEIGLSAAEAPKKAAQYGSGTMNAMKRMASRERMDLRRWVAEVSP